MQRKAAQSFLYRLLCVHWANALHIIGGIAIIMKPVMLQPLDIFLYLHGLCGLPYKSMGGKNRTGKFLLILYPIFRAFHCTVPLTDGLPVLLIFLIGKGSDIVGAFEYHLRICRVKGMGAEIVKVLLVVYFHNIPNQFFIIALRTF